MYEDPNYSIAEICFMLGVSRSTLFRYVKGAKPPEQLQKNHQLNLKIYTQACSLDSSEQLFSGVELFLSPIQGQMH